MNNFPSIGDIHLTTKTKFTTLTGEEIFDMVPQNSDLDLRLYPLLSAHLKGACNVGSLGDADTPYSIVGDYHPEDIGVFIPVAYYDANVAGTVWSNTAMTVPATGTERQLIYGISNVHPDTLGLYDLVLEDGIYYIPATETSSAYFEAGSVPYPNLGGEALYVAESIPAIGSAVYTPKVVSATHTFTKSICAFGFSTIIDNFLTPTGTYEVGTLTSMANWLTSVNLFDVDVSLEQVTNVDAMFKTCNVDGAALDNLSFPSVVTMGNVIKSSTLSNVNFDAWTFPVLESMLETFKNCTIADSTISGWDIPTCTSLSGMFTQSSMLNTLSRNMSFINADNVTDLFNDGDYVNCDLSNWSLGASPLDIFLNARFTDIITTGWTAAGDEINPLDLSPPTEPKLAATFYDANVSRMWLDDAKTTLRTTNVRQKVRVIENIHPDTLGSYDINVGKYSYWVPASGTRSAYFENRLEVAVVPDLGGELFIYQHLLGVGSAIHSMNKYALESGDTNYEFKHNISGFGFGLGMNNFLEPVGQYPDNVNTNLNSWLQSVTIHKLDADFSETTSADYMFSGSIINGDVLDNLSLPKVTRLHSILANAILTDVNFSNWSMPLAVSIDDTFKLALITDSTIAGWTLPNCTQVFTMFYQAKMNNLTANNMTMVNADSATDLFSACEATNCTLDNWAFGDTPYQMFYEAVLDNTTVTNWTSNGVQVDALTI